MSSPPMDVPTPSDDWDPADALNAVFSGDWTDQARYALGRSTLEVLKEIALDALDEIVATGRCARSHRKDLGFIVETLEPIQGEAGSPLPITESPLSIIRDIASRKLKDEELQLAASTAADMLRVSPSW